MATISMIIIAAFNIFTLLGMVLLCLFYFLLPKAIHVNDVTVGAIIYLTFFIFYKIYFGSITSEVKRTFHRCSFYIKSLSSYRFFPKMLKTLLVSNEIYTPIHYLKLESYVNKNMNCSTDQSIKLVVIASRDNIIDVVEEFGKIYVFTTAKLLDRFNKSPDLFNQLLCYKLMYLRMPKNLGLLSGVLILYLASSITIYHAYVGCLEGYKLFPILGIGLIFSRLISMEQKRMYLDVDKTLSCRLNEHEWSKFVRRSRRYRCLLGIYAKPRGVLDRVFYWLLTFSYELEDSERIEAKVSDRGYST